MDSEYVVVFVTAPTGDDGSAIATWYVFDGSYRTYALRIGQDGNSPPVGVGDDAIRRPILSQNYPNPFNPITYISFIMPSIEHANLSIFDAQGKLIITLVNEVVDAGIKEISWNGNNSLGKPISSGVYFYRLKTKDNILTKKMVLIK